VNRYYFANNVLQIKDYLARPVKTILRDKVTVITGSSNVIPTLKKYDDYVTAEDQAAKIYITTTYDEMGRELTSTQNNV
ncbi:hypothetical protein SB776_40940, partial [Burkholderia sp. SIMBA_045]